MARTRAQCGDLHGVRHADRSLVVELLAALDLGTGGLHLLDGGREPDLRAQAGREHLRAHDGHAGVVVLVNGLGLVVVERVGGALGGVDDHGAVRLHVQHARGGPVDACELNADGLALGQDGGVLLGVGGYAEEIVRHQADHVVDQRRRARELRLELGLSCIQCLDGDALRAARGLAAVPAVAAATAAAAAISASFVLIAARHVSLFLQTDEGQVEYVRSASEYGRTRRSPHMNKVERNGGSDVSTR